jgi:hypothetical protein
MRIVVTALAGAALSAGNAYAQDPVGQWRFDEGSGAIAHDTSGSGLDGHLIPDPDGPGPDWVAGISGGALRFDGDDAVALPSSTTLEPQSITVAAWVRRAGSPGDYRYIVSKGATACSMSSYALYTGQRGSVAFYVSSGGHYTLSDQPSPSVVWDGRWHRLVGTYDGRYVRLYVDGRQVGGGIAEPGGIDYGLTSREPYIGAYRGGCDLSFSGDIDTVQIYAAALSDAEIAGDAGRPADVVPPSLAGSGGGSLPLGTPPPPASAPGAGGATVKAGCLWLKAQPGSLRAGRTGRIVATVRVHGRLRAHVRLSLRGRKLRHTTQTDRHGRARLRVHIPRATRRLTLSARATESACMRTATVTLPVHGG